ncbi:MAG: saccharopine dehydrogenase family protein [Anaerolineales bacterium]
MRIVVLGGAGTVGRLIVHELTRGGAAAVVADVDGATAEMVAREFGAGAESCQVDVTDAKSLAAALRRADACINSAQYYFNLEVMRGCLEARVPYLDLGGLFHLTRRQMEMGEAYHEAGLTAVLGIGSCPGVSNVQAGWLAGMLDTVESVRIYNGTTPEEDDPLAAPYSIQTILDEIGMAPMVFREGAFVAAEPLGEEEEYEFPPPIGRKKTHLSLHSEVATIPLTFAAKGIRECFFKINFFGFSESAGRKLEFLVRLGLATPDFVDVAGQTVNPRAVLLRLLKDRARAGAAAPPLFRDVVTEVRGTSRGMAATLRADTTGWSDDTSGSISPRLVSAAPAIVARWIADGRLRKPGVWAPEAAVEPEPFFQELVGRGFTTSLTRTEATFPPGR